jgi:NAD(P)-dependent dehydrogenase (short-subunit alcohol dehydrogenase family)
MPGSCLGRVALVTGASQGGTGTGTAIRLAAEGAKVAICARDGEKLAHTLEQIEALGATGAMFVVDLSDPDGGRATLVERAEEALGAPIDILVNVAAMGPYKKFEDISLDLLQKTFELNVKAPWLLCQQVLGGMRAQGRGAIVNIGTRAAEYPVGPPYRSGVTAQAGTLYGSTKIAEHRFSLGLAAETHGQGISVNVVSPVSAIATPNLVATGWLPDWVYEPVETMVEAVLACVTGDPDVLTGRNTSSLELLLELRRPVYDFTGTELIDGWQPDDLPPLIEERSRPADAQLDTYQARGTG